MCPLLMTTPLPVHVFSQPVKCQSSFRWTIGYVKRWTSLISPSQRATLQRILTLLAHPPRPSARTCLGIGREQHVNKLMCNQAAGLSRCLTRVQDAMSAPLKTLHLDKKGKSFERTKQELCPPHWGVDILFLLFPPSGVTQFLSYLYQIWHAGLLG